MSSILRNMSPSRRRRDSFDSEDADSLTERRGSSGSMKRSKLRLPSLPSIARKHGIEPNPDDDEEQFKVEWKLTYAQENEKLMQFRDELKALGVLKPRHDIYMLRRFLRARQHNLERAKEMFLAHLKWRKEFGVDTILEDFHFNERDAFISLYPQGYHQVDKMGRPIFIQHLGHIDMTKLNQISNEERMIKFHVQEYERCVRYIMPACSKVARRHMDQTFAIIDLKGVGLKHLTGDVKKMLSKVLSIDQNNYPEMLGHTCIINAPSVFKILWGVVKPMLDARTQGKIEICATKYVPALLNWVEKENLPEYLGGTSKATLLDDAGPWQDPRLIAEIKAEWALLTGEKDIKEEGELESSSSRTAVDSVDVHTRDKSEVSSAAPAASQAGMLFPVATGSHALATEGPSTTGAIAPASPTAFSPFRRLRTLDSFADEDFYDAESLLQTSSIRSMPSDDDSQYLSPRSVGSAAPSGDPFGDGHIDFTGNGVSRAQTPEGAPQQTVLERVRALESKLPSLQQKLQPFTSNQDAERITTAAVGEGSLTARVSALEEAVQVLLTAQVRACPRPPPSRLAENSPTRQPLLSQPSGPESPQGEFEPLTLGLTLTAKLSLLERELEMLVFEQEAQILSPPPQPIEDKATMCCPGCSIM